MSPVPAFDLDWNLVRSFVAVAQGGSLAAAARQLGLAHPTVARHVQLLESALGLVLFDRTSHGLTLTADGDRLAQQAGAMQREALAFERLSDSVREQPLSTIRITVAELLMELVPELLVSALGPGSAQPGTIEYIVADQQLNLLERQADLALRHARPVQQDLICRRVGGLGMVACATREYLQRHGAVGREQAPGHWFIDAAESSRFQQGAATVGFHFDDAQIRFRSDSILAQRSAMLAGWGIAALPAPMLSALPGVEPLFNGDVAVELDVWLVARPEIRNARQMKTVFDVLGDNLSQRLQVMSNKHANVGLLRAEPADA
ncbi:MAG: LysR family transcriptional regulator [Pseudomonadales bacterium]